MNWNAELIGRLAWPHLVLFLGAFVTLTLSLFRSRKALPVMAGATLLSFALAAGGFFLQWKGGRADTWDFLIFDPFGNLLGFLLSLIGFTTALISYRYLLAQEEAIPEWFSLLLFSVLGMVLMVATTHLLTFVLALEVMSLSLYVLVALRRYDKASSEAAFKYFLLGSVATAFLLFGLSLFYGATGTLDLRVMAGNAVPSEVSLLFKWGAMLILLAFAFKVAAVPFQFWAPDVYDGAPYPITGFMATGVKVAAFGALIRVLQVFSGEPDIPWLQWLTILSLATMVGGNLAALRQRDLKRILAYSSISHAGYLLLGVATLLPNNSFHAENISPILFYFFAYSLLTLGAFSVLTALSSGGEEFSTLSHLDGLAERHPVLAATLSLFLISLAGIPPSAGFFAKYYLFSQAIAQGLYPLAIVGILMSVVSLYYYLGPVVRMYFRKREKSMPITAMGIWVKILVALLTVGVFYLGLWFTGPVEMARETKIYVKEF